MHDLTLKEIVILIAENLALPLKGGFSNLELRIQTVKNILNP